MPRDQLAVSSATAHRGQSKRVPSRQVSAVMLLSAIAVLLGILLYLWPQMRLIELGYRQGELRTWRTRALQRQTELQVELATLRQLSRIERIAIQRLGMRPPQLSQVIYVHPDQNGIEAEKKR
jgi:cell division protein FtsL